MSFSHLQAESGASQVHKLNIKRSALALRLHILIRQEVILAYIEL